jgi:hypothetical protein
MLGFKDELNEDSVLKIWGNIETVSQFASKHSDGNIDRAIGVLEVLIRKGDAKIIDTVGKTREQKKLNKAFVQESITTMADMVDQREEDIKDYNANKKREGRLAYEEIQIEYPNFHLASQAEEYYTRELRLTDTEVKKIGMQCFLVVRNITDKELNFINITYKRDKVMHGTMNVANKGVTSVTGVVDYTAKNVLTPAIKIGAIGAVSLIKSLSSTIARTGATVITSTTKGVKDTTREIVSDEEVLRATRDLINTKDAVKRQMVKIGNGGSSSNGINIVR